MQLSCAEPPQRTRFCIIEKTHTLKATERVWDSADTRGNRSTGCRNQNASFAPAICEFITNIHYTYSLKEQKWYVPPVNVCSSWENQSKLFATALGQRSAWSGSPRLLIKPNTSTGKDPENIGRSLQVSLFLQTFISPSDWNAWENRSTFTHTNTYCIRCG